MTTKPSQPESPATTALPSATDLLTPEEAAQMLRIGRTSVYKLMNTRQLGSLTIAGRRFITRQQVQRFIATRERNSRPPERRG
jgi:excisionase family DNA binding protein